jgi:hypothetical protein
LNNEATLKMGESYSVILEEKLRSLGPHAVRVHIDESLSHHYRQHVEDTVRRAGASVVSDVETANFLFVNGTEPPGDTEGRVVAVVSDRRLRFQGHL